MSRLVAMVLGTAVALKCLSSTPAIADDPRTAETEKIGRAFAAILFEQHDYKRAYALYGAPGLIQHDPDIEDGPNGDEKFFEERRRRDPEHFLPEKLWKGVIDHEMADGDLFMVHHHVQTNPNDRGRVFVDIFRIADGKIVEHWDVIQAVPANSVNGHTMW